MGWLDFLGLCDQIDVIAREWAKQEAQERLNAR